MAMIKIYGFGKQLGVQDASPYVLKVITYARIANIDYEIINGMEAFKKAPRKLLPFIEDDGKIISDSHFIINHLKEYHNNLDNHLSDEQKAQATFIQQSLDSFLYECLLSMRWQGENWPQIKKEFFGNLPVPGFIRAFIAKKSQKSVLCRLNHHTNKYPKEELLQLSNNIFASLSITLGDKPYMFNNRPSSIDAVCYAYLAQWTLFEIKDPLSKQLEHYQNLVNYCHRINEEFFDKA